MEPGAKGTPDRLDDVMRSVWLFDTREVEVQALPGYSLPGVIRLLSLRHDRLIEALWLQELEYRWMTKSALCGLVAEEPICRSRDHLLG